MKALKILSKIMIVIIFVNLIGCYDEAIGPAIVNDAKKDCRVQMQFEKGKTVDTTIKANDVFWLHRGTVFTNIDVIFADGEKMLFSSKNLMKLSDKLTKTNEFVWIISSNNLSCNEEMEKLMNSMK